MRNRLPLIFSAAAPAVAVLGSTPLGEAARNAVPLALFAKNAGKVNGIPASRIPRAGYLVPLQANGKFPPTVGVAGPIGEPGPAGPPGVTGLQLVSADTAVDSSSPKAVQVPCPSGKKVLGGGVELTDNVVGSPVAVQDSRPLTTQPGWYASAGETSAFASSWALRVWAVCATVAS